MAWLGTYRETNWSKFFLFNNGFSFKVFGIFVNVSVQKKPLNASQGTLAVIVKDDNCTQKQIALKSIKYGKL